jgi:hypothetical protein
MVAVCALCYVFGGTLPDVSNCGQQCAFPSLGLWALSQHCGSYRHCYCVCSDVQEWLGYRYTERCELEAAKFHFKVSVITICCASCI